MKKILVFILVLMMVFPAQAFAYFSPEEPSEKISGDINGIFEISVKTENNWENAGNLSFGKFQESKEIDLTEYLKGGNALVKITQKGGGASYLDAVFLNGAAPVKANGSDGKKLNKLADKDLDIAPVGDGIVLEFSANSGEGILSVTGRIENEVISTQPLQFPAGNNLKFKEEIKDFYTYSLGSNTGTVNADGILHEVETIKPFVKDYRIPDSGHPAGDTYFWVMNDDENLYIVMDFTPDNTFDGDKDYAKVYVDTDEGIKEFKVSVPENTWGNTKFTYTDKVEYEHKVYEFKIPLNEISTENFNDIKLAFVLYGTASYSNNCNNPALAYDSTNNIYLCVFEQLMYYDEFLYNRIVGEFADKNGNPVGTRFLIDNINVGSDDKGGIDLSNPSVVFNPKRNEFFVTWVENGIEGYSKIDYVRAAGIEYDENNIYNMYNTTINPFNVTSNESDCEIKTPKISYDSVNNEYLIVWSEYDNAYSIYGQFLNGNGTLKGSRFNISTTGGETKSYPSISYSESQEAFLVAWENGDNIAACGVKWLEDNSVHVSNMIVAGEGRNPNVSYNYSNQFLFVAWENDGIFGRYFDLNNNSGSNYLDPVYKMSELEIRKPHDGYYVGYPSAYYDGYRNMLTVWDLFKAEGDCYAELCYIDIYAEHEGSPFYTGGGLSDGDNIDVFRMPIAISGDNENQNIIAYILEGDNEVGYRIIPEQEEVSYIQCTNPDIAYDYDNEMYLSVFEYKPTDYNNTPTACYIYGEIVDMDGNVLTDKFPISNNFNYNYEPTVAYDEERESFLVVWTSPYGENSSNLLAREVKLYEDNENFYHMRDVFIILGGFTGDVEAPDLCCGKDGEFLLAWKQDNADIYGKIIDSANTLNSDSFKINSNLSNSHNPSIAYSPADEAFLVAWDYYSDTAQMIGARTVKASGELSGSSNIGGEWCSFPNVSFNNSNGKFLITYQDYESNPFVIKGQYVSLNSEHEPEKAGNEFKISPDDAYYTIYPASYSDGKDKMLSAWSSTLFEDNIYYPRLQYTDNEGNHISDAFYPNEYDGNYPLDNLTASSQISISGDNDGKIIIAYYYEPEELYVKSLYNSDEYKLDIGYRIFGESKLEPYIEFDSEMYEVETGGTIQAKVELYNFFPALQQSMDEGTDVTEYVTYEFNSDYITVNSSGVITGVNPTPENEPATILAYLNPPEPELTFLPMDYSGENPYISEDALIAEAKVIVTKAKEPGLEFADDPYSVQIGNTIQAKVNYFDGIAYIDVTDEVFEYKSENPEIATITSAGAITGVAVGNAAISATYRAFINDVPSTLSAITSVSVYKKTETRPAPAPEKPIIGQVLVDNKVIKNIYPEDLVSDRGIYSFEASKTGDNAKLWLLGSYYKQIADKNPRGALQLVWDAASYNLPLKCENVLKEANSMADSKVNIILEKVTDKKLIDSAGAAVDKLSGKIVSGLVDFEVAIEGKSKAISIAGYDLYVERTIEKLNKSDSYSTTAMKFVADDEMFTFAPSVFDGGTAAIRYRGNGMFAVISNPKTFDDIANHWSKMSVEKLAARNIAFGKNENTFAPNDFVTRAEFAVMITRALGITEEEGLISFDDVEGWFAEDIATAYAAGLINGRSDGKFYPNERIQRKDMAVIIHNAIKFAGMEATVKNIEKILTVFADSPEIDGYARESTAICTDAGIIMGRDNGEFDPDENATRAEASAIVERMLRYLEFIN